MIDAAERARDMNLELLASIEMLDEALGGEAAKAAETAAAQGAAADAAGDTARANAEAAAAMDRAGDAAADQALKTAADAEANRAAADAARDNAISETAVAAATNAAGDAAIKTAAKTDAGTFATRRYWLSWQALHWIVSGGAELLAVTVPAAIAAAAGAFVLYQGAIEQVGERLTSMYGATEATAAMIHKTTGDVLGLGHAFQTAQNEANPIAYELLGAYVNAARAHMVDLAQAGLQVDRALGELAARIDVDLMTQGAQLDGLLAHMVPDLIEIGQLFGNLGHAVLNLASDMPGLAEVLLKIADAASRVVLWISELPAPLITTFMVFEEFSRWGGLVVTILGRLGVASSELGGKFFSLERFGGILANVFKAIPMLIATVISNIGSAVSGFGRFDGVLGKAGGAMRDFGADMTDAVVAIPMWQAALAALAVGGFAFLIAKTWESTGATQSWVATTERAVSAASNLAVAAVAANALAADTTRLAQAQRQQAATAQNVSDATGTASRFAQNYATAQGAAAGNTQALTAEQRNLVTQLGTVASGAEYLSKTYGTSLAGGMALADAAGVKLVKGITGQGQAAQIARQQIANLVTGYKAMDQVGGTLNNDMNALAAQAGLADTKVSGLNQAWDQFLSNATGLTSSFAGLKTDIGEINNAITTSGKKFDVFGGAAVSSTQEAAYAMKSFSGVGAQVWSNYDSALQQAEQYTDSLRIAATTGAVGQKEFTQQIAYTVGQLLPYARYSKAATSQLSVLAQEAGGHATDSYKTLKDWVDKNTESSKQFMKQTVAETGAMSDATSVAEDYASTLNSQVASALQSATIASSNLTGAAEKFDNAETQAGGHLTGPVHAAFAGLITSLTKVYGNTKTAENIANTYARQLGLTSGQVKTLDGMVSGLVSQLARLHSPPPIVITTEYTTIGTPGTGKGGILPTPSGHQTGTWAAAAGLALVGESGPELVRFGGGETVLPSWQTAGITHGGGDGAGSGVLNFSHRSTISVNGRELGNALRSESLTFNRRNPSNNLRLGHGRRS